MNAKDIQCPVCGYYCLGNGGHGCIDKPKLVEDEIIHIEPDYEKDPTGLVVTILIVLAVVFAINSYLLL